MHNISNFGTIPQNAIAIEVDRKNKDLFRFWTIELVQSAFNFGHGTIKDFEKYATDNCNYCEIIFIKKGDVLL